MSTKNSNINQIFRLGGHVKVRESLYNQVIKWGNSILDCIYTRAILPSMAKFLHGVCKILNFK